MAAAIEIYNKPGFPYRNESFSILAINAWELLLKSKWLDLHDNDLRSLYIYRPRNTNTGKKTKRQFIKRRKSGTPFTKSMISLARKLIEKRTLDPIALSNLELMYEFRNCASYFYNQSKAFDTLIYELSVACVKNFSLTVDNWFARSIQEFSIHLMPLTMGDIPNVVDVSSLKADEKRFLALIDSTNQSVINPESPYSLIVNVEVKFTKSKDKDALLVRKTVDKSATPIRLTEEAVRERYPWDYRTLTDRCKQRYDGFKENKSIMIYAKESRKMNGTAISDISIQVMRKAA